VLVSTQKGADLQWFLPGNVWKEGRGSRQAVKDTCLQLIKKYFELEITCFSKSKSHFSIIPSTHFKGDKKIKNCTFKVTK
jgi:hypothetical protein